MPWLSCSKTMAIRRATPTKEKPAGQVACGGLKGLRCYRSRVSASSNYGWQHGFSVTAQIFMRPLLKAWPFFLE